MTTSAFVRHNQHNRGRDSNRAVIQFKKALSYGSPAIGNAKPGTITRSVTWYTPPYKLMGSVINEKDDGSLDWIQLGGEKGLLPTRRYRGSQCDLSLV